jgi:penicillin-insensitive murein endopeptidase
MKPAFLTVNVLKTACAGLLALAFCTPALAATPWQKITHPVAGTPQAIGGFANGCQIGAQPLPLNSPNYQVMRVDQRRYFGQPDLLAFIQRLGLQATDKGLGTMLIGDMAMPAGGRFSSGHASHQSGLDVDIWLQLPRQRWSEQMLLKPQPIDLVNADGKTVNQRQWQPRIETLIKLAAQDSDVTRIFVNPAIKQQLCADAGTDRAWLHKVRRGLVIVRICTSVCVAPRAAWNVKIRRHLLQEMVAVRNCKVGSCHLNRARVRQ